MAVTAGHVWNSQTVANATSTNILAGTERGIRNVVIRCDAASVASLRVNVINRAANQSIHAAYSASDATTYFLLAAGESITFEASIDNPITAIYVDGNGGTATFSGSVNLV